MLSQRALPNARDKYTIGKTLFVCVNLYYLNHKGDLFPLIRTRGGEGVWAAPVIN